MQIMINAEEKVRVVELERAKKSLELQLSEMAKMVAKQQEIIAQSKRLCKGGCVFFRKFSRFKFRKISQINKKIAKFSVKLYFFI